MSLRYALLGLLADRPHNGWQLLKHFEGSLSYAWPALHSQIYPELGRLRESGLIEQTGAGPRGAKEYSLTAAGRQEVERWLRETTPGRGGRDEALLRVFFLWLLEPGEVASYLEREADYQRRLLAELEGIESSSALGNRKDDTYRLALDYGLRVTRTRIEWAEDSARDVRERARSARPEGATRPPIAATDRPRPKPPAAPSQANDTTPR
jgi:DNA-binding PadR family transcriptional regulator